MTLPTRIQPLTGESLAGFLRRLARIEGYPFLSDFKVWLGSDYGRSLVEDVELVGQKFGCDLEALLSIAPQSPSDDPLRDWRFHRAHRDPFCPVCLSEGKPWSQAWRHCFITACDLHRIRLLDICQCCGQKVTTRTGGYDRCDCGAIFSGFKAQAVEPNDVKLASLYRSGIAPMTTGLAQPDTPHSELNRLIQFLASHTRPKKTGKDGKEGLPVDVANAQEYLRPVYDFLFDWPSAFDQEVKRRWRMAPSGNTSAQRLGNWYRKLNGFSEPIGAAFANRLNEVVLEHFADPYVRSDQRGKSWYSAAEAARQLGVSATRIVAAVADGTIKGERQRSGTGHQHTMIHRATLKEIEEVRKAYITGVSARELLGVSKAQWRYLREAKLVPELPSVDRPALVDGRIDRRLLQAAVLKIAEREEHDNDEELIRFSQITLRKTGNRSALLDTFRKIFDGQIKPVAVAEGLYLGDFQFRLSDIKKSFSSLTAMTAQEVSRHTGWKFECITQWCNSGLLKARKIESARGPCWAIEVSDLARFQSQYIIVSQAARLMGTSSRFLISCCSACGLETHGSKKVGKTSRGHLLRVKDLLQISGVAPRTLSANSASNGGV